MEKKLDPTGHYWSKFELNVVNHCRKRRFWGLSQHKRIFHLILSLLQRKKKSSKMAFKLDPTGHYWRVLSLVRWTTTATQSLTRLDFVFELCCWRIARQIFAQNWLLVKLLLEDRNYGPGNFGPHWLLLSPFEPLNHCLATADWHRLVGLRFTRNEKQICAVYTTRSKDTFPPRWSLARCSPKSEAAAAVAAAVNWTPPECIRNLRNSSKSSAIIWIQPDCTDYWASCR